MPAPIALFVYNRPFHTEKVLNALKKNSFANESDLFVFADGPKPGSSVEVRSQINKVRSLVNNITGFKSVTVKESSVNKGLSASITEGIDQVLENYDRIIVFEDDIVAYPSFLNFCNQALTYYENAENVYAISGYSFPLKGKLPDTYFLKTGAVWGWGCWRRSWQYFTLDSGLLIKEIETKDRVREFNFDNTFNFFEMLREHHEGSISSWDVCWYASIFNRDGLTLYPGKSLTRNIGMDGSGTHYSKVQIESSHDFDSCNWAEEKINFQFNSIIETDASSYKKLKDYFRGQSSPGFISRIKYKLKKNRFSN